MSDLKNNPVLQELKNSEEMREQRRKFFEQRKEVLDREREQKEFKKARREAIKKEQIEKCYKAYTPAQMIYTPDQIRS